VEGLLSTGPTPSSLFCKISTRSVEPKYVFTFPNAYSNQDKDYIFGKVGISYLPIFGVEKSQNVKFRKFTFNNFLLNFEEYPLSFDD
jgi:hypothetical protein